MTGLGRAYTGSRPGPLSQEGRRPDTPTHHGSSAGPRGRRWPDRDGLVHRPLDRPLRARTAGATCGRSSASTRSSPPRAMGSPWSPRCGSRASTGCRTRLSIRREVIDVLVAILFLAVVVFTTLYLLKLPNVSRLFLLLLFSFQAVLTLVSRAAIRALFVRLRARGYNARYMLVVGANPAAAEFADAVEGHTELGLRPIGYLAAPHDPASGPGAGLSADPRDRRRDPGRPAWDGRRRGRDLPRASRTGRWSSRSRACARTRAGSSASRSPRRR